MTNIIEELQNISNQSRGETRARDEARRIARQTETEARISQKIDEIHSRAMEQAKEGETWLMVSRLDSQQYSRFWGRGKRDVAPEELHDDEHLVADILKKEGFGIFVGWHSPGNEGGDPPPEAVYNYFGITWEKNNDKMTP